MVDKYPFDSKMGHALCIKQVRRGVEDTFNVENRTKINKPCRHKYFGTESTPTSRAEASWRHSRFIWLERPESRVVRYLRTYTLGKMFEV